MARLINSVSEPVMFENRNEKGHLTDFIISGIFTQELILWTFARLTFQAFSFPYLQAVFLL